MAKISATVKVIFMTEEEGNYTPEDYRDDQFALYNLPVERIEGMFEHCAGIVSEWTEASADQLQRTFAILSFCEDCVRKVILRLNECYSRDVTAELDNLTSDFEQVASKYSAFAITQAYVSEFMQKIKDQQTLDIIRILGESFCTGKAEYLRAVRQASQLDDWLAHADFKPLVKLLSALKRRDRQTDSIYEQFSHAARGRYPNLELPQCAQETSEDETLQKQIVDVLLNNLTPEE